MRFSTKLLVYSIAPAAVLATAALIGVGANWNTERRFSQFFERQQVLDRAINDMYAQGLQMGQALRNIVLNPSNPLAFKNLQISARDYEAAAAVASKLAPDHDSSAVLSEVAGFRGQQRQAQERVLDLIKSDSAAAVASLNKEETPAWREMRSRLLELGKRSRAESRASRDDALTETRRSIVLGLLFAAAGLVLAVVFPWMMRRMLLRDLGGEPDAARDLVKAIADGDLTREVPLRAGDQISLLAHLSHMRQWLAKTMHDLRATADAVGTASREIAQGNQDLSQRTEEQASALEETAASMEELSATVKQNADNARQANQLALGASTVAIKGGDVVGRAVDTMKGINDSSKKIADIIGVIDGIAFQTNILALNAAVEAARAGEQGRGFAVVAAEVRSLAGRSADAAKEIKTLITASVERVEQGTALVDQAGVTMSEVVSSIKRVTDIMGEISAASTEQSAGVAQVGEAVSQMDQATQQNAALVEESAAAAESLRDQAQQLVQAVAVFKLDHDQQSYAAASPARATAAAKNAPPVERRGPNRAKNVARPTFGAKARAEAPTLTNEAAPKPV